MLEKAKSKEVFSISLRLQKFSLFGMKMNARSKSSDRKFKACLAVSYE